MTPEQFNDWLAQMRFSGREAARILGISKDTVVSFRRNGAPPYIALACAALAAGLPPWGKETTDDNG